MRRRIGILKYAVVVFIVLALCSPCNGEEAGGEAKNSVTSEKETGKGSSESLPEIPDVYPFKPKEAGSSQQQGKKGEGSQSAQSSGGKGKGVGASTGPRSPLELPLDVTPEVKGGKQNIPSLPLPGSGEGPKSTSVSRKRPANIQYDLGIDKELPVTGRSLPPVGKVPGGIRQVKPTVVYVEDGVTYEVKVSRWMPNRIATPFFVPKVVDSSGAQIQVLGGDVFILPSRTEPFVVYIAEGDQRHIAGSGRVVVSLLLIPEEKFPAQNVVIAFEGQGVREAKKQEGESGSDSPYVFAIKEVLRDIVRGKVPSGYTRSKFKGDTVAIMGGVVEVVPLEYYTGVEKMIIVYELRNNGREVVELNEESFYRRGVRAVALFPDVVLMPGGRTRLYVLADVSGEE